jgi:F-type H+-transporting ATPase subunit delta
MMRSGIAHRYARALFQAALDAGALDEVSGDVEGLLDLASRVPRLREFLLSPQVSAEDKHALVKRALEGRAHGLFVDFLLLLIDKKRIVYMLDIAEAYRDVYRKHKGMATVKAITAVPLDEGQRRRLLGILEERTHKVISLTQVVDPDILGGMILMIDDKVLDGSVRHQLERLRRRLLATRVIRTGETTAEGAR